MTETQPSAADDIKRSFEELSQTIRPDLTGTTEPIERLIEVDFGDLVRIAGDVEYRVVNADGTAILEPEPDPLPPWDQPDAAPYWRNLPRGGVVLTQHMHADLTPDQWQGGYFIPADLIERAQAYQDRANKGYELGSSVIKAILDAADGAS
jgi:hypothetical protein